MYWASSELAAGIRDGLAIRWHGCYSAEIKKLIEPLSPNERIHVTPDGHGSRGMLIAARHQANQGLGFPLIHDITGCLRIGDVAFIRVSEGSEREYETVEIKTRHSSPIRLT
jgi:hypothetical protein